MIPVRPEVGANLQDQDLLQMFHAVSYVQWSVQDVKQKWFDLIKYVLIYNLKELLSKYFKNDMQK